MFGKVAENIWKFTGSDKSNVYLIDGNTKIIIDAGNRTDRKNLKIFMGKAVDFEKVQVVIFTHLHYDHSGNFDLFPNAQFYASKQEIDDFHKDPNETVLDEVVAEKLKSIDIKPIPSEFYGFELIETSGHTRGSVCLWYVKEKVLFTGDTLFSNKMHGRVDLPTSAPQDMKNSIMKLIEVPYKVLCPGHDY